VVICLEQGADLHMVQLMPLPLTVSCFSNLIQIGFTFLVPAHPGSPGQMAVNRVCVCACVPKAMARFSSGGVVIRFILSVLWMTTGFRITTRNRRCEKGVYSK